ncbi:MAG: hypothetical protein KKB25_00425 [Nanoarchaeota archaeon]|nr:hypothetical protein [Nanoarchaeota archaeon]
MNRKYFYKPITQKPYCCVPACISIILGRRKIKHKSQEEIGYELGLTVPKEDAHLFKKVRTGKKPIAGYGTQVQKKKYSINNYFSKNKIKLKETYYPAEEIKDVKKFIIGNLENNNDLIVCFDNGRLYGVGNGGHVSLVESIKEKVVTLIDPEKGVPKRRKAKLSKLLSAMKYHGKKRRGGFWLITSGFSRFKRRKK